MGNCLKGRETYKTRRGKYLDEQEEVISNIKGPLMVDWEGHNKEVASRPDYIYYLAPYKGGFMACADTNILTFKATNSQVECS